MDPPSDGLDETAGTQSWHQEQGQQEQQERSRATHHHEHEQDQDQELEYNHGLDNDTQASAISWDPTSEGSTLDDSESVGDSQQLQDTLALRQSEPQTHSHVQRSKYFSQESASTTTTTTTTEQTSSFSSYRRKHTSLKDTKAYQVFWRRSPSKHKMENHKGADDSQDTTGAPATPGSGAPVREKNQPSLSFFGFTLHASGSRKRPAPENVTSPGIKRTKSSEPIGEASPVPLAAAASGNSATSRTAGAAVASKDRAADRRNSSQSSSAAATAAAAAAVARRAQLAKDARETLDLLPVLIRNMPGFNAFHSETLRPYNCRELPPSRSPRHAARPIVVLNKDSFNAAIDLYDARRKNPRVAVLNMANAVQAGGGFLRGAFAQEELLCYRSSLYLSLWGDYYPWRAQTCLYSPDVVIMRSDFDTGHKLLWGLDRPLDHPDRSEYDADNKHTLQRGCRIKVLEDHKVSVVSIAAVYNPDIRPGAGTGGRHLFKYAEARDMTKKKMRLAVRAAVTRGHEVLVLGAVGCGAFNNPKEEVADCWLEVLREREFKGWLGQVVFAVLDNKKDGNFDVFKDILHDKIIG